MPSNKRLTPDELVEIASVRLFRTVTDMHGKDWLILKHDADNEAVCRKDDFDPLTPSKLSNSILALLKVFYNIETELVGIYTVSRAFKSGMEYIETDSCEVVTILALAINLESN